MATVRCENCGWPTGAANWPDRHECESCHDTGEVHWTTAHGYCIDAPCGDCAKGEEA